MIDNIPSEVCSFKDPYLQPFVSKPMVNSYRKTLHLRLAIRTGQALQRGQAQRRYLAPIFDLFDLSGICTFLYDPIQEFHQFKIAALVRM